MISISNMFPSKESKEIVNKKDIIGPSPSLNQGKKFKKYQNKIEKNLEQNAILLSGKEGFSDMTNNSNSLTAKSNTIINNNNFSSQQQTIDNLRQEYKHALKEYQVLTTKISRDITGYVDRVNPNNPYLNKTIRFTTGHICYVTNQGVVKYIPSTEIWNSVNIPKNYVDIGIPWQNKYSTPGTTIRTNPPLVSGTFMKMGQSIGAEGTNVFVNELLPSNLTPSYKGCYAANSNNDNMTFLGGSPPPLNMATIENGTFSQPALANNTFKYIRSSSQVPGWYFGGPALINNSSAWGYPMPYPGGNQCVSIQGLTNINTILNLNTGVNYTVTFSGCSRNCCNKPNVGNPINIQLYTNLNAFISTIASITPPINSWTNYTYTFTVPTTETYKLKFAGTNSQGDQSTAIANVSLNSVASSSDGNYKFDDCKQAAITNGYRYFGLQNVNLSTGNGYCAVSNSEPAVTQFGTSTIVSKLITLWSSNTADQTGNTATLDGVGSIQLLDSGGTIIFSTPVPDSVQSSADPYIGCYSYGTKNIPQIAKNYTYTPNECMDVAVDQGALYVGYGGGARDDKIKRCFAFSTLEEAKMDGVSKNCKNPNGGNRAASIYATSNANSTGSSYLILQDDGNMCIYSGTGPNDNQGLIWQSETNGKQQQPNPNVVATKGKFGKNWMASGSSLAAGDFVGSTDGSISLVMQSDGNLVLYTYQMDTNCQKMSDGNMGGGLGANAAYDMGVTAITGNMGKLGFVDSDSNLYTYPSTNQVYTDSYRKIEGIETAGNDIPGAAFGGATVDSCQQACNSNPDCAGFDMPFNGTFCYPKTNAMFPFGGPSNINPTTNLYVRGRQPSSLPLGVGQNTNNIDTIMYKNYINKGDVGSQYGLANATTTEKQQLEQLQSRMNLLTSQINDLTGKFQSGSNMAEQQSYDNNKGIYDYANVINTTNKKIIGVAGQTSGNIQNILKDSDIVVLQKNYDYLFWSILATGTVLLAMNVAKKQ